jgi:hypothetical protein
MSFFGGPGGSALGGGQIIIGAQTSGFRRTLTSAVGDFKSSMKQMAGTAQTEGARASRGVSQVGTSAEKTATQVEVAERRQATAMRASAAQSEATSGRISRSQKTSAASMAAGAAQAERSGSRWNAVFNAIGTGAKIGMLAVVGAVALGVKSAAGFEKEWSAVIKTVGGSAPQMAKLREQFLGLAQTMPTSLSALAQIGETAGALGIPTAQVAAFTKVVAQIGATTNVSTEQAATSLGQLGNVLKLRQKDYERFGSTLVDLGNKGASTEKQILDITTRAGAAGALLGLRTDQILAIASTTASLGIAPEAAGTALQRTFIQLLSVTNAQDKNTKSTTKLRDAQASLHVAELKLNEVRGKHGVTASQVAAAELRVSKAQEAVTKASTTGVSKQQELAKAAGYTVEGWKALLKNDPGKAIQAFVDGLGKMTEPQRLALLSDLGLKSANITRTILGLAGNPRELARQLGIADTAWKTNTALADNYQKKTANLIDRLKVLGNVVQVQLIRLGDAVLPGLTKVIEWITKNLPAAIATAGRLWSGFWKQISGPVGGVVKSLGGLFAAFTGGDSGKAIDWSKTVGDALSGVARVINSIAKAMSSVIDIGAQFVRSPIGQFAVTAIVPILALIAALSALTALSRRLTGATVGLAKGALSFIPGLPGFLRRGGPAMTPEAAALTGSAKDLTGSAAALRGAAAALEGAGAVTKLTPQQQRALTNAVGGLPGGGEIRGITPPVRTRPMTLQERMAYAGQTDLDTLSGPNFQYPRVPLPPGRPEIGLDARGRAISVPIAGQGKADYLADQKAFDTAGRTLMERASGVMAAGASAAASGFGKLKSIASDSVGMVKAAGSLISKAFWPLMLASMAGEFLAQPISEWIGQNTGFKNVAKKMSTDFWGGAYDLLVATLAGTDAFVGHAELTTIGRAKISTLTIAKLGFTSAEIGNMQAPTLANGGFQTQAEAARILRDKYATMSPTDIIAQAQTSGIDVTKYDPIAQAISRGMQGNVLDSGVLKDLASGTLGVIGVQHFVQNAALTKQDVQPLVDDLIEREMGGTSEALRGAVTDAITKLGYDASQLKDLPPEVIARLGKLIGANANGKIDALVAYSVRNAVQGQPSITGDLLTGADIGRRRPAISGAGALGAFGSEAQRRLQSASFGPARIPPGYLPPGGLSGTQGLEETPLARANRGTSARGGAGAYGPPGALIGSQQTTADANAAFKSNLAKFAGPAKATYRQWLQNVANDPTGNRQVANEAGQQFVDRFGKAIGQLGRTGKDTKGFRNIAQLILGPDAVTRDAKGVQHLAEGAWSKVLAIYDDSLFASGAGQRSKIAKLMADIIKAGAADGSSDAAAQMTPLFFATNQKAIEAAVNDPKGKDLTKLLASFNKANPTAQFGNVAGFKAAYEAWKKTGMLDPSKAGDASLKLKDVHSYMEDVADGAKNLTRALADLNGTIGAFLDRIANPEKYRLLPNGLPVGGYRGDPGFAPRGDGANAGTPRSGGGGGAGSRPAAGGAFFDTRGQTHLTVGEAGGETVAVLANPRRWLLPNMRPHVLSTPGIAGANGGGGRTTQIYADKLQVLGPADERSLLERFAFMSNS